MPILFCPNCGTREDYTSRTRSVICKMCKTKIAISRSDGQLRLIASNKQTALKKLVIAPPTPPAPPAQILEPTVVEAIIKRTSHPEVEIQFKEFITYSRRFTRNVGISVVAMVVVSLVLTFFYLKSLRSSTEKFVQEQLQETEKLASFVTQKSVETAFQEKNIADLIEAAAQKQVAQQAEQKVNAAMVAVEEELSALGKIADAGSRLRIGLRAGLVDLINLQKTVESENAKKRASDLLKAIARDYEEAAHISMKAHNTTNVVALLRGISELPKDMDYENKTNLLQCIRKELDMGCVALAFIALREKTGVPFEIFDIEAVETWFQQNPEKN